MVDLFFGNKYVIIAKNSLFFAIYGIFSDKYWPSSIFLAEMKDFLVHDEKPPTHRFVSVEFALFLRFNQNP